MDRQETCFLCLQCGVQFAATETPPEHCPICEDERQYVRWEGQAWITPQLASTSL
jgi:rubrerythrin